MNHQNRLDLISHSTQQTQIFGATLGQLVEAGQVVALVGHLGAGKTQWAKGFGLGLGLSKQIIINSPTFTFVNEYQGRLRFYHIDVYRLNRPSEVETLGLDTYLYGDGVCLIEWADRVQELLPGEYMQIILSHDVEDEMKRYIKLQAYGRPYTTLLNKFQDRISKR